MDAIKAGIEKTKEAIESKTVIDKLEKIHNPNAKPSERMDAQFEADQATAKAAEHKNKHCTIIMDALKAGMEKVKEAFESKKADEKLEKANDPNVKPSERMDAEFEANKAAAKAAEHHGKAEEAKTKHTNS